MPLGLMGVAVPLGVKGVLEWDLSGGNPHFDFFNFIWGVRLVCILFASCLVSADLRVFARGQFGLLGIKEQAL